MKELPSIVERDVRQRLLVPPTRLAQVHAVVIGVGAVGRQVALQLSALGVNHLTLFDHDSVSIENLAPQGYWPSDLGLAKVNATAEVCRRLLPDMELRAIPQRFTRSSARLLAQDRHSAVFMAVDAIETRRLIWEAVRPLARFVVDGRMAAEVIRVLAVDQPRIDDYYANTLFAEADAYQGQCTARSTIYTASIAAGLMIAQFARWLRNQPALADQTLNLLAAELTVADSKSCCRQ